MFESELHKIIKPLRTPLYQIHAPWNRLQHTLDEFTDDFGPVVLDPDYQRGHVWSAGQQRAYIENVLRGMVSDAGMTIQFNTPDFPQIHRRENPNRDLPREFQCLDGLQRLTAVQALQAGELQPFGLRLEDLADTSFDPLRIGFRFTLAIYAFQTREELLQHYLDINTGGTPHTPEEIARVRGLLDEARSVPTATPTP